MARQYLKVRFDGSQRDYTYHNDGDPVAKGDRVMVQTGRTKPIPVTVSGIIDHHPGFETKPIRGRVEDVPSQEQNPQGGPA